MYFKHKMIFTEFFLLKCQEASKQATGMQYFTKLSISWNWQSVDLKMSSIVASVRNAKWTQSLFAWCPNSKNNIASCFPIINLKFRLLLRSNSVRQTHLHITSQFVYRLYSPDCHFASSRHDAHNCNKYHQGSPLCIKWWALLTHVFTPRAHRLNWERVVCGIRARPGTYAHIREKLTGPACLEVHNSIIESSPLRYSERTVTKESL